MKTSSEIANEMLCSVERDADLNGVRLTKFSKGKILNMLVEIVASEQARSQFIKGGKRQSNPQPG